MNGFPAYVLEEEDYDRQEELRETGDLIGKVVAVGGWQLAKSPIVTRDKEYWRTEMYYWDPISNDEKGKA